MSRQPAGAAARTEQDLWVRLSVSWGQRVQSHLHQAACSETTVTAPAGAGRGRRGREFLGEFLCGVGASRYELGEGGRGGAGATDEDETNGRSMTIMNKVGLKLSPSSVASIL